MSGAPQVGVRRLPLDLFAPGADPLSPTAQARWVIVFLALGVAARLLRFALRFPLWYDEAALAANFLERGPLDYFRPLECGQTAPILFLGLQWGLVRLLGFHEYALRLFPLVSSLASLALFAHLARRLLRGTAALLALGVFAASYPAIRYSAEGKPYGSDALVSLALVALAVEWLRQPQQTRWLWILAGLAPVALGLSFPAVFVAGAVSLTVAACLRTYPRTATTTQCGPRSVAPPKVLGSALRTERLGVGLSPQAPLDAPRRRRAWLAWSAFNALVLLSFAASLAVTRANVTEHSLAGMQLYWKDAFPPAALVEWPGWLAGTHTGELMAHPVGGKRGASAATFLAAAAGVAVLARRRQAALAMLLLAPAALNLAAAVLHRYPYGGHVRLAMHLAPAVCLLSGMGGSAALAWLAARRPRRAGAVVPLLVLLAMVPAGSLVRDLAQPARTENDQRFRDFARWFWVSKALDAELVCLRSDLRVGVDPLLAIEGDEAMYLCNQRIYSPRHARRELADLARVSTERPLRCVRFRAAIVPPDEEGFQRWLAGMAPRYRLAHEETYLFPVLHARRAEPLYVNRLDLYEFVPR